MIISEKQTILLIEDSPTIRLLYRKVLETDGFDVIEAEDGESGWEMAVSGEPDLILLDLILPDSNGLEVLERIRASEVTKNIPVIVLTTMKRIQDIQQAINLGANYYAYKGSDSPKKILSMIHKLLGKIA
ncbi:response regulator [bacterium]|nr:response regulator [bacterium]